GPVLDPTDEITVPAAPGPAMTLVKTAAEATYDAVGDILHFTITATNTGNVTLTEVSISDPQLGALSCTPAQPTSLAPGESLVCTGMHVVTQADLDAGSYLNAASATATPPIGGPVLTPPAETTVPAGQTPTITLLKSADPVIFDAVGQTIIYTYIITNTGNVTLPGPFTVTDNKTTVTCNPVPPGGLLPQATLTCTATYQITQADLDSNSVTNIARASANGATSNQVSATIERRALPAALPSTGFAPGHRTLLPDQPAKLKYDALGDFWLEIPALNVKASIVGVPIDQGSWQLDWLGGQIGYLAGTAFPTWNGNSVLTAHVYNANGLPGPFVNLGKMRWGQQVIIHAWGQSYIYEIRSVQNRVNPNNTSIITHEEKPWLTLITCQGYDEDSDSYKWRIVVRAVLVKVK
ncbi:MAG: sortase, partial [Anaerolineae bacterium]|nr:sortase [Anaerolineae bacterium]